MSATLEVYVWFEAEAGRDDAVRSAVARLAESMAHGGSDPVRERPRLLRRPDLRQRDDGVFTTWMEIWPAVPAHALEGWIDRLAASAADSGAAALARNGRHVEPFIAETAPGLRG